MAKPAVPVTERIVAAAMLVALLAVVGAVLKHQPARNQQAAKTLPSYTLPSTWQLIEAWQTLPEDRMYEKINGRAVLFQEHGAVKLDTASVNAQNASFDIFIYTMKSPDAALGVFLAETNDKAQPLELGDRANRAGGLIRILKGDHYLVIMSLEKDTGGDQAIELAAALVEQFQPQPTATVSLLDRLPKLHQIAGTAAVNPESAFGLESLKNSFAATYKIDNLEFALLLKKLTPQTIKTVAEELREFDATNIQFNDTQLTAEFFGQQIILIAKNNILYGIYGSLTAQQAKQSIQWAIEQTEKNNGQ